MQNLHLREKEKMNTDLALLTVSEMIEADQLSVDDGVSSTALMESAGAAVAAEIMRRWAPRSTAVLCGPGNNGGDGFVVARHLAKAGWKVTLGLLGTLDQLRGDATHHAHLWDGEVEPLHPGILYDAELVVDAIFGAGLNRPLSAEIVQLLRTAYEAAPVVAVDIPSGVMGDTGASSVTQGAVLTVTFFRKKPGHVLLPGRKMCGEVVVADIGTPAHVLETIQPTISENGPYLWCHAMPQLEESDHKYTRGHAVIWGGYPMTGAARLSARAASRSGAGLTTVAVPEIAFPIYAASLTSIMVQPVKDRQQLAKLLTDDRITAILIGPGAGIGEETQARVLAMMAKGRPCVLDADALTSFAHDPQALERELPEGSVLTPHEGEFSRLFDVKGDKLARARAAARRSGAVVVLKGSDTVISAPDGRAIINTNAPPTLATAGSGDVLCGIIVGLIAQGMDSFLAAAAAVWLHGAAASAFGRGLIAEDIPDLLPSVLEDLFKSHEVG